MKGLDALLPVVDVDLGACQQGLAKLFDLNRRELVERLVVHLRHHPKQGAWILLVDEVREVPSRLSRLRCCGG